MSYGDKVVIMMATVTVLFIAATFIGLTVVTVIDIFKGK